MLYIWVVNGRLEDDGTGNVKRFMEKVCADPL